MEYNLSSNMAHRISFDEMLERAAEATLAAVPDEIANIKKNVAEYISDMWELENDWIEVDDMEEAKARFFSVYERVINDASN